MQDHHGVIKQSEANVLERWLARLRETDSRLLQLLSREELDRLSRTVLNQLIDALENSSGTDIHNPAFAPLRGSLERVSADFAERGFSPSETASYIFSLKEALFDLYRRTYNGEELAERTWQTTQMIDALGLYTVEVFGLARERIIKSQAQALTELSTPVIQVWEGVVALPLVGTVDSARAKEIMEKLLEAVVAHEADIAIIDITGVPVVDTQVANRLMRTVEAVRLLGTKSVITGINPIIAQTLVQLGVDLSQLNTKASLRAGLEHAFRELGVAVASRRSA